MLTSIVHHKHQNPLRVLWQPVSQTCPNLLCSWRCKDCASYTSRKKTTTDISGPTGLVAGSAATDDGDLVLGGCNRGRIPIHDFIRLIEKQGRICQGQGTESCKNSMVGVMYEVFSYL